MKSMARLVKRMTLVTQFAFSLLTPTVGCLLLCWFLCEETGVGLWIYIPGFILGLGSSFMVAYKLYLRVLKEDRKEDRKKVSFNSHV